MVKVMVTPSAIADAKGIFSYYEACFSHGFAQKLLKEFIAYARRLEPMPEMGAKEMMLAHLKQNYRYVLVFRRYKLIYLFEDNVCSILMVWDCKRNSKDLKNSSRFDSQILKS